MFRYVLTAALALSAAPALANELSDDSVGGEGGNGG